jgi:CHAT domain-containing protein/tetratricopeptide (TPR) repeat protein
MPSCLERREFTCDTCGAAGQTDVWLIADTTEIPGILEQLRCGTVHQVACPRDAAHVNEVDAPLLLYRPRSDPPLLFLPAKRTSPEEDQAHCASLLQLLKEQLGLDWNDAWTNPLTTMSQELARFFFSPEARGWRSAELDELFNAALEFAQCATWTEARAVLDRYPKLLTPLADVVLLQLAKDQENEAGTARVEAARAFLNTSRVVGSDRALADKLDAGEDQISDFAPELIDALRAFMAPPTWEETREVLRHYKGTLLTRSAVQAMQEALQLFAGDADMTRFGQEHLDLLAHSLGVGIDAAVAQVGGRKFAPPDATARLVNARRQQNSTTMPRLSERSLATIAHEREQLELLVSRDAKYQAVEQVALHAASLKPEQLIPTILQILPLVDRGKFPAFRAVLVCTLAQASNTLARIKGSGFEKVIEYTSAITDDDSLKTLLPEVWGEAQNLIGEAYRERGDGNVRRNIELAIAAYRRALEVFTYEADPKGWAQIQNNLGAAYYARIEGSKADNLETARECYESALRVRTLAETPYDWAITQNNLGNAFLERVRGPEGENTEVAIRYFHQAMQVLTRARYPEAWAMVQNNLGTAYRRRPLGGQDDNLDRAVHCFESALRVWNRTTSPSKWAMANLNLANVHLERALHGDRSSEGHAERDYRDALEVYTQEQQPHAFGSMQNSLGLLFAEKAKRRGEGAFEAAIGHFRRAFEVFSRQSAPDMWAAVNLNLATTYARAADDSSLDGERGGYFRSARQAFVRALSVFRPQLSPHRHVLAARGLGDLHFKQQQWKPAHAAYRSAFAANELLYEAGAMPSDREMELVGVAQSLANHAYAMTKLGIAAHAVEQTERRLARGLAEILGRRGVLLDRATPADRSEFKSLRDHIGSLEVEARSVGQSGSRDYGTIAAEIRSSRGKLSILLARIENYLPDFLPSGLTFEALCQLVRLIGPVVYLVGTVHGALALVLRGESGDRIGVEPFWHHAFKPELHGVASAEDGRTILERYFVGIMSHRSELLYKSLSELWPAMRDVMEPLTRALADRAAERMTLISLGELSFLPLHAAADGFAVACAPSALVVQAARKSLGERRELGRRLLAIGDPAGDADPLPLARIETQRVAALFGSGASKVLLGPDATRKNIASSVAETTHFHFAGHSYFDMRNPLQSAMLVADGDRLRLQEFFEGRLDISHVKLFVLSSCQTALRDLRIPGEAIGFPGALLQAGVPGIISTLWPVADISTSLLMTRFYQHHLDEHMDAPTALCCAQSWIRKSTAAQLGLQDLYGRLYESSGETDARAFRLMQYFASNPGQKPFEHPYFWAGFAFYGVG